MKRLFLIALLGLIATTLQAQYVPPASNPVCAYCGVSLTSGESHKVGCKYYEEPNDEPQESSSFSTSTATSTSSSTHLQDYEPLPEVQSKLDISYEKYQLLYRAGVGDYMITCPTCHSVVHEEWCAYAMLQNMAIEAKAKAIAATTLEERKSAIIYFHVCEQQLLESYEHALAQQIQNSEDAGQQAQNTTITPTPGGYQHLTSVDIKNGYDKKIACNGLATAYGKTFPNGRELWVLYDKNGQEVGRFTKVEYEELSDGAVFFVRDEHDRWGICNAEGRFILEPDFESVKTVVALQNGQSRNFFDFTRRDSRGMLRHGLINASKVYGDAETIPCVCNRIELVDRSPAPHGVLAIISVDGHMGVMDADKGEVLIQPYYSVVNTYFTPKGMYFTVGDGIKFGAYFAETMELVVSPDDGKSLIQVLDFLDQKDRR